MARQFTGNLSFFAKARFSLGFRHADGAFDDLANSESNHDTYEGIRSFNVWDAKATYQADDGLVISAGIDNTRRGVLDASSFPTKNLL